MEELWQIYDEQGRPLENKGAERGDIFGKGLLHGASHVWICRLNKGVAEILLQKRSATKETWPNLYEFSAGGHVQLHEKPLMAAVREAREEIGIHVAESDLRLISVQKVYMTTENGKIENEFQYIYLYELRSEINFTLQNSEVAALQWQTLEEFKHALESNPTNFVPHGNLYFSTVINAIEFELANRHP